MPTSRPKTRNATPDAAGQAIVHGDALRVGPTLPRACAALIYLDPPFFSGKLRRNGEHAFNDRWPRGLEDYLSFLRNLLETAAPLLTPHGLIALHLDWRASHWGRVELERLFGAEGFVNEIVWSYRTGGGSKRQLGRKHDSIFVYAAGPEYTFNPATEKSRLAHRYGFSNVTIHDDGDGPYTLVAMRDVWEIPALRGNMKESTGYPTQKPLQLLERLCACFTNPGDLVLDLCCGSGTALVAARNLGRRSLGVDSNARAVALAQSRLSQSG
jgi:site-specific DNA-methyltransferase (adenine-specific)